MPAENIPLFKAIGAKMNYLNQRQSVISQNIANADTPDYRPRDLVNIDFGQVLDHVRKPKTGIMPTRLETSHPEHMMSPNHLESTKDRKQKITYEVAPAGNAVIMEEQVIKSRQTSMDYALMTNLYKKQVGMVRTALGK